MPIPQPNMLRLSVGHPVYLLFTGAGTLKSGLRDFGYFFDAEVADDTVQCMIVDPRYNTEDVAGYIVERGGLVYVRPPEAPPITE